MKNVKKIGNDLPKSLAAISALPETIEPTISAKGNKKLINVKALKMKKTIIKIEVIKETNFCFLSNEDNNKLSLLKKSFIITISSIL